MEAERTRLRRRYLSLGLGELCAATIFVGCALTSVAPRLGVSRDAVPLWAALGPLVIILSQAGSYWLGARRWVARSVMPPAWATAYRTFRAVDPILLAAGLAVLIGWWPDATAAGVLLSIVWVFALVEYLNYFVVRLSYPARQWAGRVGQWRRPQLIKDLDSAVPAATATRRS